MISSSSPRYWRLLERIERQSGSLLMLAVTASGGREYTKLNKLRGAGYIVKCDHPSVTEGAWPAEALAITEAGRVAGQAPGQTRREEGAAAFSAESSLRLGLRIGAENSLVEPGRDDFVETVKTERKYQTLEFHY